ncbi:MAG TPA: efflux RND transporter permease subunit [Syntrophobacteraceae bacterium]|nr:efflux RND transporter permease subunit [Syntrophobacteraceae bacterium]
MDDRGPPTQPPACSSWIHRVIWFCLERKILVLLFTLFVIVGGIVVAPFDWKLRGIPRYPVPVDAIPDISENQQIVYTEWPGRSPRDIQDQVTYPLTASLLGLPGVKAVRGYSYFGFSNVYVIFKEDIEFYWSRSRLLEKLSSLPPNTLPKGVQPTLGPDATALGQVMWYTLEGRGPSGKPAGGWDLDELRTLQDWYVRFGLLSAEGVSEVASVGGYVREYQIDVDPNLMRIFDVKLEDVVAAANRSNLDVGAAGIEINKVEYIVRGVGFVKGPTDLENALIKVTDDVPVFIRNVAYVHYGPAQRGGALDNGGAEAVGGVVTARRGANPLETLNNVKEKIREISAGLPSKVLADGTVSRVEIVPFYDRSGLIYETLGTLSDAVVQETLTAIVVILLVILHLESSLLISSVLPLAVLLSFLGMKLFGVDANIVSLAGIAIAIGTLDDMGIVICENILKHLQAADPGESRIRVIFRGASEVGGAVLAAAAATIISFLPVFALDGAEGKLFKPLAWTKTFALLGSAVVAVTVIPAMAHLLFFRERDKKASGRVLSAILIPAGILLMAFVHGWLGGFVLLVGLYKTFLRWIPEAWKSRLKGAGSILAAALVALLLTRDWLPFGPEKGLFLNFLFVAFLIGGLLSSFLLLMHYYRPILGWCLDHKGPFLLLPAAMLLLGATIWLGFPTVFGWLPSFLKQTAPLVYVAHKFPGMGEEFMPPLDEGSFLYMPITMPHASIGEGLDIIQKQDKRIRAIAEVESVVGKLGRAESPLDPAPASMIETLIQYRPQYLSDRDGRPLTFRYSSRENDYHRDIEGNPVNAPDGMPYVVRGRFLRDSANGLLPDPYGKPFRLWRPPLDPTLNPGRRAWKGIRNPDDLWDAITAAANIPGSTQAPKLQPISARLVMLQSGIRASMGVRVKGPDLPSIENACAQIERYLREVPSIEPKSVIGDKIIGKPYLEIRMDREALAQYEIDLEQAQRVISVAVGGDRIMTTVEGRERFPVRVRYLRELRDDFESIGKILVPSANGSQIPLMQLADIRYVRGPEVIRTEDTYLVGYVLFDKKPGIAEVEAVEHARDYLNFKVESAELQIPKGVGFSFTGSYENQVRSENRLRVILPLVFAVLFVIFYLQFKSVGTALLIFTCIPVAWAGGFILLWLYGQPWFLNFELLGTNLREVFRVHPIFLSVAVWVGFLALFGIAADDNIVMATYLEERFAGRSFSSIREIRETTIEACRKRIRPCLMTTATTILALLPVLTSSGRGSDIMLPMAVPSFGGLTFEVVTMLVAPVLYCAGKEFQFRRKLSREFIPPGAR